MRSLAGKPGALVQEWFERTLQDYPEPAAGFIRREKDPFRNPVGHAYREGLAVLFEEVLGEMDESRLTLALEEIIRIRAVQDSSASHAVGFLFLLKEVLRADPPEADLARLEARIDKLALMAFDIYMRCREKIYEIKANETRRRYYLLERVHLKRGDAP